MSLRLIARLLLQPGTRIWVAGICTTVALTASGLPCLCACLGHSSEAHASSTACHPSDSSHEDAEHAEGDNHCPPASVCVQDQVPAVSTELASPGPAPDQSPLFPYAIAALNPAHLEAAAFLESRAAADRGPPIAASKFEILRL